MKTRVLLATLIVLCLGASVWASDDAALWWQRGNAVAPHNTLPNAHIVLEWSDGWDDPWDGTVGGNDGKSVNVYNLQERIETLEKDCNVIINLPEGTFREAISDGIIHTGPHDGIWERVGDEYRNTPALTAGCMGCAMKRIETLEKQVLELQERVCTLEEGERKEWELLWEPIELGEGDIDLTGQGYPPLYTPTITVE